MKTALDEQTKKEFSESAPARIRSLQAKLKAGRKRFDRMTKVDPGVVRRFAEAVRAYFGKKRS